MMPEYQKNPEHLRQKMKNDPFFLPTVEEALFAFHLSKKSHPNQRESFEIRNNWEQFFFDVKDPVFELFTQEYITELCTYLMRRIGHMSIMHEGAVRILEVGAGNGRLTYLLKDAIPIHYSDAVHIIATDSYELPLKRHCDVKKMATHIALSIYRPDIVLCSWMPMGCDWTSAMRKQPTIQEYILIGEERICGDPWLTWGDDDDGGEYDESMVQPYVRDGFIRSDLINLWRYQIGRGDNVLKKRIPHSTTVSFQCLNTTIKT